jgi:mycothiol synthase
MTTIAYQGRAYRGPSELEAICQFLTMCEQVAPQGETFSVERLDEEFHAPGVDAERDLQLWDNQQGQLIGFAQLWISDQAPDPDTFVWFRVHPDYDQSLGEQIIAWADARTQTISRERGVALRLRAIAFENDPERIALLERNGFTIDRYFYRMARPLDGELSEPSLPTGFRIVAGPYNAAEWLELFNSSFSDHWNNQPWTLEELEHERNATNYQPQHDLVAIAPDGRAAGFSWGSITQPEQPHGQREGQIGLLGTHRDFRGIGLGRALLLAGMRELQRDGANVVKLSVDADSPTGATRLYTSVGFQPIFRRRLYGRNSGA